MTGTVLSKEDLWDMVVGGSAISTGGGGVGPTRDQFDALVDPALANGLQPTLLDPTELSDEATVYMGVGAGGGVRREERERYLQPSVEQAWTIPVDRVEWTSAELRRKDYLYPLGDWASLPDATWDQVFHERMIDLCGTGPDALLSFEVGPNNFRQLLSAASRGLPVVDADTAGHRAVPEVSMCSLNVHGVPAQPVLFGSPWGDLLVLERVVSWQRMEDIGRYLAIVSGGSVRGQMSFDGATVRDKTFRNTLTKARTIGQAIRAARNSGQDVADAAAAASNGHVLFRGTVQARMNEDHTAFIWGTERILGTGEYAGKTFRIWYKNENHMSWVDDRPYVMSPDIVTVLDAETGYGLSNFDTQAWSYGREVVVLGVPCDPLWRSERGLRIFHPWRWGFACDYTPLEDVITRGLF